MRTSCWRLAVSGAAAASIFSHVKRPVAECRANTDPPPLVPASSSSLKESMSVSAPKAGEPVLDGKFGAFCRSL